jgi:hypothetical protein
MNPLRLNYDQYAIKILFCEGILRKMFTRSNQGK